jgi:hypothetical protein
MLTAAAVALVVLLVRMLLTVRRQVPIIVGCVTSYRLPLQPIALVDEDRSLIKSLGNPGKSFFDPGSAVVIDTSSSLSSATADEMVATLSSALRRTKPGGPDGNMAIVYRWTTRAVPASFRRATPTTRPGWTRRRTCGSIAC